MSDLLRDAAARLRAMNIESPRAEARILWAHSDGDGAAFERLLRRRLAHEPIAYIMGRKEFWSLDFEVGPGVLIPRPETETLVEQALRASPDRRASSRVLDLGTGSGCLLVALLTELPNATAVGIDISEIALQWARRNLIQHGLASRSALIRGSWDLAEGRFDLIVSNPPYISSGELPGLPPDILGHEPRAALDGGADGLDAYRAIAFVLPRHLKPCGLALLEMGAGQHHMVTQIMEEHGLAVAKAAPDLAGAVRCLAIRQVAGPQRIPEKGVGKPKGTG